MTNEEVGKAIKHMPWPQLRAMKALKKQGYIVLDIVNSRGDQKIIQMTRLHPIKEKTTQYKDVFYDGKTTRAISLTN